MSYCSRIVLVQIPAIICQKPNLNIRAHRFCMAQTNMQNDGGKKHLDFIIAQHQQLYMASF
jgi:hypothetical protein